MELPAGYQKIKTLKEETGVVLATDPQGRKVVIKPGRAGPALPFWREFAGDKGLAVVMPEHGKVDGWVWHEYIEGEPAGDTMATFGWRPEVLGQVSPEKLVASIVHLQSLSYSDLPKRQADFYLSNLWETHRALEENMGRGTYERVREYLSSRAKIIDRPALAVANGDLHPQNIIVSQDRFGFADWDLLHLNNPGFDLADIFVWAWRDQEWRMRLLEAFLQVKPEVRQYFEFCLLYLAAQMIKHCLLLGKEVSGDTSRGPARRGLLKASKETIGLILKGEFPLMEKHGP